MPELIDPAFQDRVDAVLKGREVETPALGQLRRIPMDLIALAVSGDLEGQAVTDQTIGRALVSIAIRNSIGGLKDVGMSVV